MFIHRDGGAEMTSAARSSQVASRKFATAFRVVDVQPMSTKTCASTVPVQYPYFVSRTPFSAYLAAEPVFVSYPPPPPFLESQVFKGGEGGADGLDGRVSLRRRSGHVSADGEQTANDPCMYM